MEYNNKPRLTAEQVQSWTDEEFQNYRQASWTKKREQFASDTPADWFMGSKDQLIKFLERGNKFRR
ncbi:MAG: hypothetical protein LBS76_00080 [Mycoplasmataceae bacterium]|jgi:hypothetical protein|nr:hypothetical protein [Mycoplasmataceae bacterium]